ncbi:MAG: transposase [Treponema sp.]|nr:transposase [Treponema sp.]
MPLHNAHLYEPYAAMMHSAKTAAERKAVVGEMSRIFGISAAKAYKHLAECGWESGRKTRKDTGQSEVSEAYLTAIAALVKEGIRKNGKQTLSVEGARAVLEKNGFHCELSDNRLRQLLREKNMSAADMKVASPHQRMRTEYPNQVHQVDPSVALLYYTPQGQKLLSDDEVYKNKPYLEGKEQLKCWRYVLTDHYSGSICIRYYAQAGENAAALYDFLLYAWGRKKDTAYCFHGLPETLACDLGSANKAKAMQNALESLRVRMITHMPGNPRMKGQVEKMNNVFERKLESLLRIEPVNNIEELNALAERACSAFNSNTIDGVETSLRRGAQNVGCRLHLWQSIKTEQLRELPDVSICREIFTRGVEMRKVRGDLSITIVHPQTRASQVYDVSDMDGILVGMGVNVQPILIGAGAKAKVSYKSSGEIISAELAPLEFDRAGFDTGAPVFGKEYARPPDTTREKNWKELGKMATLMRGALKAHSDIAAHDPFAHQRIGSVIDVVKREEIMLSATEATKRVKAKVGFLPEDFLNKLKADFPNGVSYDVVEDLAHDLLSGKAANF